MDSERSCSNMRLSMQFTIRDILIVFVLFAACLGLFGILGIVLAVYLLVGTIGIYHDRTLIGLLFYIFIGLMGYFVLWHNADPNWWQRHCRYRLAWIEESLKEYHAHNGHYPPAIYLDTESQTRHSWRILLNQFMNVNSCQNYDFKEPWNGPNNKMSIKPGAEGFRCSLHKFEDEYVMTNYIAVSGNSTLWPEGRDCIINDIPDGADKTIFLIEWPQSDIHWMEPRDLTIEQVGAMIESMEKSRYFCTHTVYHGFWYSSEVGVNALFADGKVRFLPLEFLQKNLMACLTRNGGEPVDFNDLQPRLNWPRIVGLAVLAVSVICLLRRPKWESAASQQNTW